MNLEDDNLLLEEVDIPKGLVDGEEEEEEEELGEEGLEGGEEKEIEKDLGGLDE